MSGATTKNVKTLQGHWLVLLQLTRSLVSYLAEKTEHDSLIAMLSLEAREENIIVASVVLNNMHQDHDEPTISFSPQLKRQA